MSDEFLTELTSDGVLIATLNRPEQMNALNGAIGDGLHAAIDRAKEILHRLEQEQIDTDQIHAADGNGQSEYPIKEERVIVEPEEEIEPEEEASEERISEPKTQLELFPTTPGLGAELAGELSAMELSQVTPLQALLKLHEWKEKLKETGAQ